jgi:hypothetical protein
MVGIWARMTIPQGPPRCRRWILASPGVHGGMNDDLGEVPIDLLLQDFGVPCTTAAGSGLVLLDAEGVMLAPRTSSTRYTATGSRELLGGVQAGDQVTINQLGYTAHHEGLLTADGQTMSVILSQN